jgi:hypothetical protein
MNNHYHLMNAHESFASFDICIHDLEQLSQDGQDPDINAQLVALKTKRNAMTPFCAAPDEVILARWPCETDGFFEIKHFIQHVEDDWTSWLVFLRDLPSLEVLFLRETGSHTLHRRHAEYIQMMWAGSSINMPHLRVLSITDDIYATNLLVAALPMPSHSLSVIVDFMYQHALLIPLQHDREELQDILFGNPCVSSGRRRPRPVGVQMSCL